MPKHNKPYKHPPAKHYAQHRYPEDGTYSPLGDGGEDGGNQHPPLGLVPTRREPVPVYRETGGSPIPQNPPLGDGGEDWGKDGGATLYHQLLSRGFSQQDIHSFIHKYLLQQVACKKAYRQLTITGKIKWQAKRYVEQVSGCYKHLTAKGMVLLKTQFAKKPKQPV